MDDRETNPLPTIFNLIVKQQAVSEQTNRLVEGIMNDVSKVREQSEKLAILMNRVENMERSVTELAKLRNDCISAVTDQIKALDQKREENKDRIARVEQQFNRDLSELRSDYMKDLDKQMNPVETIISELREKIAFNAGKYGGAVALVISLVMMLIQWTISHPPGGAKP
jgi:DNA anti-recombination protein RmuC